ncbi:hypothetical protein LOD99_2707 [Oopsacas minuta]|uniref:Uncharacterized protein n=1 Tax=Oopsacas minuta TaxID=111878 RepID=A0AAV7K0V6_9METZ|nr:hypothetical protein LOD99_2707 [Oopsacas minuta]
MSRLLFSKLKTIFYPNIISRPCPHYQIRWKVNINVDPTKIRFKKLPKIELEPGERLPLMNTGKHRLRVYKTLVVNTDGSSYYAESPLPYEITFLPLDLSKLTKEELEKRRIAHLPDKKDDGLTDQGFSDEEMQVSDDYKHLL